MENKIVLEVVLADNWEDRKQKCDQINKENRKRKLIFSLIVTFLAVHSMSSLTVNYFGNYIEKNVFNFLLWLTFMGIVAVLYWIGLVSFITDIIDASVVKNGGIPIFKQIADTGAVLSYMITTYSSEIIYVDNRVEISCNVNKKKGMIQEKFFLEECRCDYSNIEKPTLYLQDLRVVLSSNYR